MKFYLCGFLIWFVLTKEAFSLQCYQCSSMVIGDGCRKLTKSSGRGYLQLCQGGGCQTRYSFDGSVQRLCGMSSFGDSCHDDFGARVCYCTTDKCNAEPGEDNQDNAGSQLSPRPEVYFVIVLFINCLLYI